MQTAYEELREMADHMVREGRCRDKGRSDRPAREVRAGYSPAGRCHKRL